MKRVSWAALTATALLAAAPAHAATVYAQDFSSGLGANEQVGGEFVVSNGQVGHADYYSKNAYAFYQLALDLTDVSDALLTLDFLGHTEVRADGFNILASADDVFSTADLITPTNVDFYGPLLGEPAKLLGPMAYSGIYQGPLVLDLSAFDGLKVNLKFQFASDYGVTGHGIQLDNLKVTGLVPVSAVPEPATWAMMIAGFGLMGTALRRRRASAPRLA